MAEGPQDPKISEPIPHSLEEETEARARQEAEEEAKRLGGRPKP